MKKWLKRVLSVLAACAVLYIVFDPLPFEKKVSRTYVGGLFSLEAEGFTFVEQAEGRFDGHRLIDLTSANEISGTLTVSSPSVESELAFSAWGHPYPADGGGWYDGVITRGAFTSGPADLGGYQAGNILFDKDLKTLAVPLRQGDAAYVLVLSADTSAQETEDLLAILESIPYRVGTN